MSLPKNRVFQKITYEHPITAEVIELDAPATMLVVDGFRSHHPICVFKDGTYDDEDYFYRILDRYNGSKVAKYDYSIDGVLCSRITETFAGVVLMSFDDWKRSSPRVCGDAKKSTYTFRAFVRQLQQEQEQEELAISQWLNSLEVCAKQVESQC